MTVSRSHGAISTDLIIELSELFDAIFNEQISDFKAYEEIECIKAIIATQPLVYSIKIKAYRTQMLILALIAEADYLIFANSADRYEDKISYGKSYGRPVDKDERLLKLYRNEAYRHHEANRLFKNRADHAEMLLRSL